MAKKSLFSAFKLISALTVISRIFGFLRDIVFAQYLGASISADAFFVAFKLPNLFRRLTAEGALTNAFLPVYSSLKIREGLSKALIFAAEIQTILLIILLIVVLILEIFMPFIIYFLAPGFINTPERMDAAIEIARFTIPYLPMISLVALWSAITNANDDFFSAAFSPIIMNVFLIGSAILIPFTSGLFNFGMALIAFPLAIGVLLAGISQILFLQIRLRRKKLNPVWRKITFSSEGKKMWLSFFPAAIGAGIIQINLFVDMILASFLKIGSISWLYYADRIAQLPLGVVGIALGTALLPKLSAYESKKQYKQIKVEITNAFKIASIFVLPATLSIFVISEEIISGLFERGKFNNDDVIATSKALIAYGVGLPAFVAIKILQPAIYAMKKNVFILKISLYSILINIVLSIILMKNFGHMGIAMATSFTGWFGFAYHLSFLVSNERINFNFVNIFFKSLFASLIMCSILFFVSKNLDLFFLNQAIIMVFLIFLGLVLYFLILFLLGIKSKKTILN